MATLVVGDRVLDAGLSALSAECDKIYVCSQEPTTYTEATSAYALGSKSFTRGTVFGSPAAAAQGRKSVSAAITDGSIASTGTVNAWAAVDSTTSRLLSEGNFSLPWTPADLTNLIGWYKADAGITGSSPVTVWADQSSAGNNLNTTQGTAGPAYSATGLNGKPALTFVASSNNNLATAADSVAVASATQFSIWVLGSMSSATSSNGRLAIFLGNGHAQDFDNYASIDALQRDASNAAFCLYETGVGNAGQQSISYNTEVRFGMVYDGTHLTTYLNGVAGTPIAFSSISLTGPGRLSIGGYGSGGWWDGAVREVIVTNGPVNGTEIDQIDAYLAGRA